MEWKRMDAYQTLVARLQEKYRARDGAVSALLDEGVPGKLLARARKMRRRLADNLCMPGPAVATDAKVTARLQQDGYAIENVIITDDTGYAIPVNLYLPDAEPGPHPAVVVSMGHWPRGTQLPENQIFCANLARCGIIAATYDPICQGERSPFSQQEFERCFGAVPEDIQAVDLHMQAGNLSYLLGENLGALFVRDSMRVVDYLCSRPDVDTKRIGATGQSGGGTQTTYLAALDDRICCYSPIQCLTKQAMTLVENGIGDCEQSIVGISAGEGFDYADVLWAAVPKPCMLSAASEDFFLLEGVRQLEGEMRRLYKAAGNAAFFSVQVAPCAHVISAPTRMFGYDFFCRQLLNKEGPASEVDTAVLKDEQLACLPHIGFGLTAIQAWKPALEKLQAGRPSGEALRAKLAELYDVSSASYTVQPLWREDAWQTFLLRDGGREGACRSLCRGSHTLCVAITHPEQNANGLEASGMDVLRILPWGMQSAFAKTRPGYDAETALFNAAAVLGEKLTACRLRQIADVVHYLDEQNGYERVVFVGQGPGALLALLAAALLPKARGAALLETQLSFDALFEADYYFAPETAFETGLLRLCDLPDLAKLAGRVCAFTPKNPAGGSLAPHTPTPIPAHWEKDALSAAAEWLEDKLC